MVVGLAVNLYILLAIISCYMLDYFNIVMLHDSMLQCKRDINLWQELCKKVDFYSGLHPAQTGFSEAVNAKADGAILRTFTLLH